jgi:hypothetical protein
MKRVCVVSFKSEESAWMKVTFLEIKWEAILSKVDENSFVGSLVLKKFFLPIFF